MGKELEAFLAFASDPESFKAKMQEFNDAETRAATVSAQAKADLAALRSARDAEEDLRLRTLAFDVRERDAETAIADQRAKLEADTIRLNDRAQGLARDEAALQARVQTVQVREATATRLINEGAQKADKAQRLHQVFTDAVNGMMTVVSDAKAKISG